MTDETRHGFAINEGPDGTYHLRDTAMTNRWSLLGVAFDTLKNANDFAWKCFEFKAGQRQTLTAADAVGALGL